MRIPAPFTLSNVLVTAAFAAALCACGPVPAPDEDAPAPTFALIGSWDDDYGYTTAISQEKWGDAAIVKLDVAARVAFVQSPAVTGQFSKYVWTALNEGRFYYCTVDFNLDTLAAAEASTKVADATKPAEGGCGGFSWTLMSPAVDKIEVKGNWRDNYYNQDIDITTTKWGFDTLVKFDNGTNYAIVSGSIDGGPVTFSKNVWTELANNTFWSCTIEYGQATAAAAEATTKLADATNPAEGGCGAFPWSKMSLRPLAP